jgi:hypothetical protein
MNEFVNKVIHELKTNESIKNEVLVNVIAESAVKSISLGENISNVYADLKNNLSKLNENMKDSTLSAILEQFKQREYSDESAIDSIDKGANLSAKLNAIKESAGNDPIVLTKVAQFESAISSGTKEIHLYNKFIEVFESYSHNSAAKKAVANVKKYLNENLSKVLVMNTIFEMEKFPMYASAVSELRKMVINETHSADILKVKFNSEIPAINSLVSELRVLEANQLGYFTLGEGNIDTQVRNVIAPALRTNEGRLIVMHDNRFLAISEGKNLDGTEKEVHVNENFKIATINPEHIASTHSNFYKVCESYFTLGFKANSNGTGVESSTIKNFKIGFRVNESKSIDLYLNDTKIDSPEKIKLDEALALESNATKSHVSNVFNNLSSIFNFEFIKEISNDRTLAESLVFNLGDKYYVCEKSNVSERIWTPVNEHQMYEFFMSKYQYDISPIFKVKIEESVEKIKVIEEKKSSILTDVEKLEQTIAKLQEALSNSEIEKDDYNKLTSIKSGLEEAIVEMKNEYVSLDLSKK